MIRWYIDKKQSMECPLNIAVQKKIKLIFCQKSEHFEKLRVSDFENSHKFATSSTLFSCANNYQIVLKEANTPLL